MQFDCSSDIGALCLADNFFLVVSCNRISVLCTGALGAEIC